MVEQDQIDAQTADAEITQELLDQALRGNPQAREEFWRRLMSVVSSLATRRGHRMGLKEPDILDVAQNVVLKLYRAPEKMLDVDNLHRWLFRVVDNALTDQVRRLARSREKSSLSDSLERDEDSILLGNVIAGNEDNPEDQAYHDELMRIVSDFLETLPRDRADVYRLYISGLSHKAIAQRTNLPLHTINNIISRTKERLWRHLENAGLEAHIHGDETRR